MDGHTLTAIPLTERGRRDITEEVKSRRAILVETAVLVPLLVALVAGIGVVSSAYGVKTALDAAVRDGARHGATLSPWDPASSVSEVRTIIDAGLVEAGIDPRIVESACIGFVPAGSRNCGAVHVGAVDRDSVVVALEYPYSLNFLGISIPIDFDSRSAARYRP